MHWVMALAGGTGLATCVCYLLDPSRPAWLQRAAVSCSLLYVVLLTVAR